MKIDNILFIGDPHFNSRTPLSRLDDYADLTIKKLDSLLKQSIKLSVTKIIFTGDFFDTVDQTMIYMNRLILKLNEFKDNNIEIYSIIGNHDFVGNNLQYFPRSPLHMLFQTGVIKQLDTLVTENKTLIQGLHWTERETKLDEIKQLANDHQLNTNILVQHYAVDNTIPNESINRTDLDMFKIIVAGHDHKPYLEELNTKQLVLRPGSFIRRTKDVYNLDRDIYMYLYNDYTQETTLVTLDNVDHSSLIFKNEVFNNSLSTFAGLDLGAVFNESYFKREAGSLKQMIETLPISITRETKDEIIKHITSLGLE